MTDLFTPTLEDVIEGTYGKQRYRGRLDDIRLDMLAAEIRHGKRGTRSCGVYLSGDRNARNGTGFPDTITDIEIIGVSAAKEGVTDLPELHFAATHKGTGRRILGKGVSREQLALQIVTANDMGTVGELAARIAASRHPVIVTFTDVRYTNARKGSDMPTDPERAFVRRLTSNAARGAKTNEEAVGMLYERASKYAAEGDIQPERAEALTEEAVEKVWVRKPGKRSGKASEPPKRDPMRISSAERSLFWRGNT